MFKSKVDVLNDKGTTVGHQRFLDMDYLVLILGLIWVFDGGFLLKEYDEKFME